MVYLRREAVLAVICFLCFQKIVSVAGHQSVLHLLSAKRVKENNVKHAESVPTVFNVNKVAG